MENLNLSKISTKKIIQRLLLWVHDDITNTDLFNAYLQEAQNRVKETSQ